MGQSVAGVYCITLVSIEFHHAAGKLARDTDSGALYLTFDIVGGFVHKQEADDGDYCHSHYDDGDCEQQRAVGAFFLVGVLLHVMM